MAATSITPEIGALELEAQIELDNLFDERSFFSETQALLSKISDREDKVLFANSTLFSYLGEKTPREFTGQHLKPFYEIIEAKIDFSTVDPVILGEFRQGYAALVKASGRDSYWIDN